jgi:hypothetical protein
MAGRRGKKRMKVTSLVSRTAGERSHLLGLRTGV